MFCLMICWQPCFVLDKVFHVRCMISISSICLALFCLDRWISMCLGLKMPCCLLDRGVCESRIQVFE